MIRWGVWLIAALSSFAMLPVWSQDSHPPQTELWEERDNGDAVQKDLGFILPKQWKVFERVGFRSARADGAAVKTQYRTPDGKLLLHILIQLRPDVRGMDLGEDFSWQMAKLASEIEYKQVSQVNPTELSSERFSLGKRSPAGRTRWARYDLPNGAEVQGLWWQNIGLWSVVITLSGPEARRDELQAHANTLLAEMPFPSAPLATELAVKGEKLLAALPQCPRDRPEGTGAQLQAKLEDVTLLSILMPPLVLGRANDSLISPLTRPGDYCRIETFSARKGLDIVAIQYTGAANDTWHARYGFALNNGQGGYYQFERFPVAATVPKDGDPNREKRVYLNFSNNKRASLFEVFDDWPSYDAAKQAVTAIHANPQQIGKPIITMTNPADKVEVVTNRSRLKEP